MTLPILLLLFNRPKLTKVLISKLKEIKPSKIYINIDGPRKNNSKDIVLSKEVMKELQNINWTKNIKIKLSKENKGCRKSVKEAIDWVLSEENSIIILEDDCIPSIKFFNFCSKMITKFKDNNRIKVITGNNFQNKKIGDGDYYFSKYAHCWGWATWKRAWNDYDEKMSFWNKFKLSDEWKSLHQHKYENEYWKRKFDLVSANKIDSWAYVWLASIWFNKGVSITPNQNLVQNIGFNHESTHTYGYDVDKYSRVINDEDITFDNHPKDININKQADLFVFESHFNGKYNFWPWRFVYIVKILIKNPNIFLKKLKNKLK